MSLAGMTWLDNLKDLIPSVNMEALHKYLMHRS